VTPWLNVRAGVAAGAEFATLALALDFLLKNALSYTILLEKSRLFR